MSHTEKFITDYFPENIVRDAVGGCCHDFAYAVHRRTGWQIGVLWRTPIIDQYTINPNSLAIHLFCIAPDGRAVDVEGANSFDYIHKVYDTDHEPERYSIRTYNDEQEVTADFDREDFMQLWPRDHGIEAADRVIDQSPAFLRLLENLKQKPKPPTPGLK